MDSFASRIDKSVDLLADLKRRLWVTSSLPVAYHATGCFRPEAVLGGAVHQLATSASDLTLEGSGLQKKIRDRGSIPLLVRPEYFYSSEKYSQSRIVTLVSASEDSWCHRNRQLLQGHWNSNS